MYELHVRAASISYSSGDIHLLYTTLRNVGAKVQNTSNSTMMNALLYSSGSSIAQTLINLINKVKE